MSLETGPPPQLAKVRVDGLLGKFSHEFEFPEGWDFLILHGVNGVGKTKVLNLIKSALSGSVGSLLESPFESAELFFHDGTSLGIERNIQEPEGEPFVSMKLQRPNMSSPVEYSVDASDVRISPRVVREIERNTHLVFVDDHQAYDPATGETLSSFEVLEIYKMIGGGSPQTPSEGGPDAELRSLWSDSNVHLIETQRLLRGNPFSIGPTTRNYRVHRDRIEAPQPTVIQFAEHLKNKLTYALGQLGQVSQELDRTFPERLIKTTGEGTAPSEESVRARYEKQSELGRRLAKISMLEVAADVVELPDSLDDLVLRVMNEYLSDSEKKFEVVEEILSRLELFLRILNEKFQYKTIKIDRSYGFIVETDSGEVIGAEQLSSGEQHELVLLYDLLFRAKDGGLVLVDEPEISLHINWQKRFLSDMAEVSKLKKHRFIVATHSPQIVGSHSERMIRLGEE